MGKHHDRTFYDAKRMIGMKYANLDTKMWPFTVVPNKDGNPLFQLGSSEESKTFKPEEVSAQVLKKLK